MQFSHWYSLSKMCLLGNAFLPKTGWGGHFRSKDFRAFFLTKKIVLIIDSVIFGLWKLIQFWEDRRVFKVSQSSSPVYLRRLWADAVVDNDDLIQALLVANFVSPWAYRLNIQTQQKHVFQAVGPCLEQQPFLMYSWTQSYKRYSERTTAPTELKRRTWIMRIIWFCCS